MEQNIIPRDLGRGVLLLEFLVWTGYVPDTFSIPLKFMISQSMSPPQSMPKPKGKRAMDAFLEEIKR